MRQSDGKVMAAVMLVFVLAIVAMAVVFLTRDAQTEAPPRGDEAIYTAQDLHAAVAAATQRAQQHSASAAQAAHDVRQEAEVEAEATSAAAAKAQWRARQEAAAAAPAAPAVPATAEGRLMPMPMPAASNVEPALQGSDGLALLIRQGVLRRASPGDLGRWLGRARSQSAGVGREAEERLGRMPAYVINGAMRVPEGLSGAHSVIFLIDAATPHPMGSLGHSLLLDIDTGGCMGITCAMHLH